MKALRDGQNALAWGLGIQLLVGAMGGMGYAETAASPQPSAVSPQPAAASPAAEATEAEAPAATSQLQPAAPAESSAGSSAPNPSEASPAPASAQPEPATAPSTSQSMPAQPMETPVSEDAWQPANPGDSQPNALPPGQSSNPCPPGMPSTSSDITQTPGVTLAAQGTSPAIRGTIINSDVFDNESLNFSQRVLANVVRRPAPQVGMTRGAVEAIWGPEQTSTLAPGRDTALYVNNLEIIDGVAMPRRIGHKNLKVYEVVYAKEAGRPGNLQDRVIGVKPIQMPSVGDHVNLYALLLNNPDITSHSTLNRAYFSIPQSLWGSYRKMADNAFDLVMVYTDAKGRVVSQEFIDGRLPGTQYSFTSAGRYIQQPDLLYGSALQPM